MIERQIIDGRGVTVAYLDADMQPSDADSATLVKLIFDDGQHLWLTPPADDGLDDEDEGDEVEAWRRHRQQQRAPYMTPTPTVVPIAPDVPVKIQIVAWAKAIQVIDASEVLIRDLVERELSSFLPRRPKEINAALTRLMASITRVRTNALRVAFRLLRSRIGDVPVFEHSLATWAQVFLRDDIKAIDNAIRTGLIAGLDSTEIARRVVGSMGLNGVDGVTEYTRHKIAHLGRAAIKASRRGERT